MYEKMYMNISELWSEGDRDCINCGKILLVKGKPVQMNVHFSWGKNFIMYLSNYEGNVQYVQFSPNLNPLCK